MQKEGDRQQASRGRESRRQGVRSYLGVRGQWCCKANTAGADVQGNGAADQNDNEQITSHQGNSPSSACHPSHAGSCRLNIPSTNLTHKTAACKHGAGQVCFLHVTLQGHFCAPALTHWNNYWQQQECKGGTGKNTPERKHTLDLQLSAAQSPKLCISVVAKVKKRRKASHHTAESSQGVLCTDGSATLQCLITAVVKGDVFAHYGLQLGNIHGMNSTLACLHFQHLKEASESPP